METKQNKHRPSLRVADTVEIDAGPHAGCVGVIEIMSLTAYDTETLCHIRLQTGELIEAYRSEVSKV